MKRLYLAAAVAVAISAAAVAGSAMSTATAQQAQKAPVILIVDRAQVIAQSKAGKTIPPQADKIKTGIQGELTAEAEKLKKDIESYQKNSSLMSQEVRSKTEQELGARQQYVLPQQEQVMQQAFAATVQNAEAKVLNETVPILKDILEKRGATVLLDRAAVMYAAPETDITAEVIAALDKKVTTIAVEPVSLAKVTQMLKDQAAKNKQAQTGDKSGAKSGDKKKN
jgi:outer membrane protein